VTFNRGVKNTLDNRLRKKRKNLRLLGV